MVRLLALILVSAIGGCVTTVPMSRGVPLQAVVDVAVPASVPFGIFIDKDPKIFIPIVGDIKYVKAEVARYQVGEQLKERGFDAGMELQRLLVTKLTSRNVQGRPLSGERPHERFPPKVDIGGLPLQGDSWAVLDARITGLSLNADMSGEFRPQVALLVQLIEVGTKRVLYDNRFVCNTGAVKNPRASTAVRIPYDARAEWPDLEAIRNDLPGVRAALVAVLDQMADLIATDIASKR